MAGKIVMPGGVPKLEPDPTLGVADFIGWIALVKSAHGILVRPFDARCPQDIAEEGADFAVHQVIQPIDEFGVVH